MAKWVTIEEARQLTGLRKKKIRKKIEQGEMKSLTSGQTTLVFVDALDFPIEILQLSVRAYNCLKNANILTLGKILSKRQQDLRSYKNFSRSAIKEIQDYLATIGLSLREDGSNGDPDLVESRAGTEYTLEDRLLSRKPKHNPNIERVKTFLEWVRLGELEKSQLEGAWQGLLPSPVGTWIPLNDGLPNRNTRSLVVLDTTLYAATHGHGVFALRAGAQCWAQTGLAKMPVLSLASFEKTLYAGTKDWGIFASPDDGVSWIDTGFNYSFDNVWSLAVFAKNIYAGTEIGLFTWDDEESSWVLTDLWCQRVRCLAVVGNCLFAGTHSGLFRSEDGSDSWVEVTAGPELKDIWAVTPFNSVILLGCRQGILYSNDEGISWLPANSINRCVLSFAASETALFAGAENSGVFKSEDGGITWRPFGLEDLTVRSLAVINKVLYAGTDGSGVFRTSISFQSPL